VTQRKNQCWTMGFTISIIILYVKLTTETKISNIINYGFFKI
jgi:hypothetical protein